MQKTNIEWADYVWNPVTGCTKVSQGCKNCYAETFHHRFEKTHGKFTNVICHYARLHQPLKVKKGGRVFVNSMSDLFHESVPYPFILDVFNIMVRTPHLTYLILTKRPEKALKYFTTLESWDGEYKALPNVWIGVSCEDQATANERIPLLLQLPAAVRFLSCEPLLGPINLVGINKKEHSLQTNFTDSLRGRFISVDHKCKQKSTGTNNIHWVIAGGESGHKARPMHPDWARSLRDQCAAANVPFFFKQWGEWLPIDHLDGNFDQSKKHFMEVGYGYTSQTVCKVGKSKSGALLDGKEHQQFPVTGNRLPVTGNWILDYVLNILRKQLKREKYFGTSAVVAHTGGKVAKANAQFCKDRIPQLKLAIEILSHVKKSKAAKSKNDYKISKRQLKLFWYQRHTMMVKITRHGRRSKKPLNHLISTFAEMRSDVKKMSANKFLFKYT